MATTSSKFVRIGSDDGVANYPSASDGSVTLTNGGSKSIIIVSNGLSFGAQGYARIGGDLEFSKKLFFINRKTGSVAAEDLGTRINYFFANSASFANV